MNKLLRTLEEFREYFDGMTVENWLERPEPAFITSLNRELANATAAISPGNSLNYISCAVLALRPFQCRHFGSEVRKEDIRTYWLHKSDSRMKDYIIRHWSNICTCLKNRSLP